MDVTDTQKYKKKKKLEDQSNHFNFIEIHHSISSIHNTNTNSNDKNEPKLKNRGLFYDKIDTYWNKSQSYKNKPVEKMKKSTVFVIKLRSSYKKNYWKSEPKTQNQERNLKPNNKLSGVFISSIKYRMVKFFGCKRPIFMLINRSSNLTKTQNYIKR